MVVLYMLHDELCQLIEKQIMPLCGNVSKQTNWEIMSLLPHFDVLKLV